MTFLFYCASYHYSTLFADDLSTLSIFHKPKNMIKTINSYLEKLNEWLKCWRLKMSTPKCSYTVFSNGPYRDKREFELRLAGHHAWRIALFQENKRKVYEPTQHNQNSLSQKVEIEQRNPNLIVPLANWLCHRVFFFHNLRNIHQHTQLFAINPESSH